MARKLILCFVATCISLRAVAQEARHRLGDPDYPTGAQLIIDRVPNAPTSMGELCAQSSLIIEGTVSAVLPARDMGHHFLETDSVIHVNTTLKGSPVKQLAISQAGGTKDGFTSTPVEFAVVKSGEQYILFVKPDNRPTLPPIPGMERYLITGIWSGLFYFRDNVMSLNSGRPDPFRSKYVGMTLQKVLEQVNFTMATQKQEKPAGPKTRSTLTTTE